MTILVIIILICLLSIIVYRINQKSRYYKNIFCHEHYIQILTWIASEINRINAANPLAPRQSNLKTDSGVALVLTKSVDNKKILLQLSISEWRGVTTHAVAGRIISLIIIALNKNKADAELFYTDSTVHHLVLVVDAEILSINDTAVVLAEMEKYQRLTFEYRSIKN